MPITANQLEPGDVLFKHASQGAVSQAIAKGQMSHYVATVSAVKQAPVGGQAACDITHVALAAGPDDVLEFDEGGASKGQIVFGKGHGFVRGPMNLPSRRGKRYEVYHCTTPSLAATAVDKAELIWDLTHQGRPVASYGLGKMLGTALGHNQGEAMTASTFEARLDGWLREGSRSGIAALLTRKPNIQFFCSEFVSFCYLWSAAESNIGQVFGPDYILGTDKVRVAPVELYTRMDTVGRSHFVFKGTLYA